MSKEDTTGDQVTDTPPTYKEQLDEAAIKVKNPQSGTNEGVIGQVVEKGKYHMSLDGCEILVKADWRVAERHSIPICSSRREGPRCG